MIVINAISDVKKQYAALVYNLDEIDKSSTKLMINSF